MRSRPQDRPIALVRLPPRPPESLARVDLQEKCSAYSLAGLASNTLRAYQSDIRYFWAWARLSQDIEEETYPVSADVVRAFVLEHAPDPADPSGRPSMSPEVEAALRAEGLLRTKPGMPHKVSTMDRRLSALSRAHVHQGLADPTACVRGRGGLLSSIGKTQRARGVRKMAAATGDVLTAMLDTCGPDLIGIRDRALLLFGFCSGGRRRSEIAAMRREDLTRVSLGRRGHGYMVLIRHSKTDQQGRGLEVPLTEPLAVRALDAWLAAAGIEAGPLFRPIPRGAAVDRHMNPRQIARVVQSHAAAAGLDASAFGGHSLRRGFVSESGRRGIAPGDAMKMSGHKSVRVFLSYYESGAALNNPAAVMLTSDKKKKG